MLKTTFDLETVAELAVHGADTSRVEFRPPSLRGGLRYWFRALAGGVVGDNPSGVYNLECQVFGGPGCGSPLAVRACRIGGSRRVEKGGEAPGAKYRVELCVPRPRAARPSAAHPAHIMKASVAALWTLTTLGAVGARSRRGQGTLRLLRAEGIDPAWGFKLPDFSGFNQFCEALRRGLRWARGAVQELDAEMKVTLGPRPGDGEGEPSFPILDERWAKIVVDPEARSGALDDLMRKVREYRAQQDKGAPDVFGFAGRERQASPLHVRVVNIGGGQHLLLTAIRVQFQPWRDMKTPAWPLLERFLGEFDGGDERAWVWGRDQSWDRSTGPSR